MLGLKTKKSEKSEALKMETKNYQSRHAHNVKLISASQKLTTHLIFHEIKFLAGNYPETNFLLMQFSLQKIIFKVLDYAMPVFANQI